MRAIRINEYLADATNGQVKYIELYNTSGRTVDILGSFLSIDRLNLRGFTNTLVRSIPPRGFVAFQKGTGAGQFSFDLHPTNGGTIFLTRPDLTAVIDAVAFGAQSNGASMGRFPDGVGNLLPLATPTRGTNNAPLLESPVVINELFFNPISGSEFDEYVELYNRGPSPVNLSGWKLSGVDNYTFANGTTVTNNGYLIVPRDRTNFLARYPSVPTNLVAARYSGNLSNRRETLRLSRPHVAAGKDVLMHEMTYEDGGRWGGWISGDGSSLELVDPRSDNRAAANWMNSDETAKSTNWILIAHTNIIDHVMLVTDINRIEITLQGAGECLVDNIEVWQNGVQYVTNGTFEVGSTGGWNLSGNHDQSGLESSRGYNSGKSLRLRAAGRGDNLANFARGRLTNSLTTNMTVEIRARVLWLAGSPDIVLRLIGNGLEAAGTVSVPKNLGTPGAVNSRYRTNNGPAIDEVAHWPPVPGANQRALVTARVRDPDGLGSVVLRYRVDPATSISSVTMRDDGTGGDRLAGDGTFSGTIPGQVAGQMVAFHVQATDAHAAPQTNRFPADATTRECLVLFGDAQPAGELPTYRLWMTRATAGNWISRGTAHNAPLDTTFVYGNQRVVYNARALYSGSQFSSGRYNGPTNNLCSYALTMPEDDPVLGATDFAIEFPVWDTHAQREQLSYWLAGRLGLPSNHRRFIHFVVNGWTAGARTATISNNLGQSLTAQIYEDAQQPNGDLIEQYFSADPDGSLYKIEVATEQGNAFVNATLEPFLTTNGMKKTARYRWNWRKRAVNGSAHDYSTLFALVDAANATTNYTATVEALVDVDEWMRLFAFERMVANWDTWGWRNGHNIYAYKGNANPWRLLPWDLDVSLGVSAQADGYEMVGLFDDPGDWRTLTSDPVLKQMIAHPPFRRMFWRAVQDAVHGPLRPEVMNPVMDANYALMQPAYTAMGPGTSSLLSPDQSMSYVPSLRSWITNRHSYLTQQLATVNAPFEISNNGGNNFTVTNHSTVTLLGKAPVEVAFLRLNGSGANAAVTWTGVTNWSLSVPLSNGANGFSVEGYNRRNEAIPGASDSITVTNQP